MSKQMDNFKQYKSRLEAALGAAKAEAVLKGAVYAISTGSNDLVENYFSRATPRYLQYTLPAYTTYLMGIVHDFITELHSLGASKIGMVTLGTLGCLPPDRAIFGGLTCNELHNSAARAFNEALRGTVQKLRTELPGSDVRVGEIYDLWEQLTQDPARYGFARADVGCCGTGRFEMGATCSASLRTCPDHNAYLFWDAAHLTEHANKLFIDHLMNGSYAGFAN